MVTSCMFGLRLQFFAKNLYVENWLKCDSTFYKKKKKKEKEKGFKNI